MKTSPAGIALIKKYEGCRLTAYRDVVGVLTIGWGHTGPDVHEGLKITQAKANKMLVDRLASEFESMVERANGVAQTTQAQFDAMVSLAYNIGVGAFAKSSVAYLHTNEHYADAADSFLMFNKAGGKVLAGLVRRRTEERALYLSSVPEAKAKPNIAAAVRGLQTALNDAGASLDIDGVLGTRTVNAYRAATR